MKLKATFAPRRDGAYGCVVNTTDILRLNESPSYSIDENGIVDVPEEFAQHLIGTGNFALVDAASKPMMITNGDTTVNLMTLDKAELLAIANEEMNLGMNGRDSKNDLRAAIHAHANKTE